MKPNTLKLLKQNYNEVEFEVINHFNLTYIASDINRPAIDIFKMAEHIAFMNNDDTVYANVLRVILRNFELVDSRIPRNTKKYKDLLLKEFNPAVK